MKHLSKLVFFLSAALAGAVWSAAPPEPPATGASTAAKVIKDKDGKKDEDGKDAKKDEAGKEGKKDDDRDDKKGKDHKKRPHHKMKDGG